MSEAGFSGTFDKASSWFSSGISSLGQRTRTMAAPPTSSAGLRVFQPRNTTSIVISKGLLNAPGENNCFLNSAVQVLWHLDVFRRSFRDMAGHACMGKACIFCALKVLFTQLQYGEEKALPPDALRKALASAFKDEHRFQLGCMDDAAECFENILVRIHFHLAHNVKEDLCDAKHCVSHQKFAMTLIEHCVCPCGATSEPFPFTQMVHYVSCTALCGETKRKRDKHHLSSGSSAFFGQLLRSAGAIGDVRACPSECGKKVTIRRVLMNCPDVVGIGLVWDSDRPSVNHIMDVISCLGTTLRLPDLFNSVVDDEAKKIALNLVGVVTYYGKHYSTFFYNTKRRLWIYFDDASVKQVGPNWRDVAERCRRGHFQPLLLLYANPNGRAVDIATAPKDTAILPEYQNLESPDKPRSSSSFPSSGHHSYRSTNMPSHSGGNTLESTGAVYKPVATVPEFSASSRPAGADGALHSRLNSVVEIGHDAVGGLTKEMQHQLSIDNERSHGTRSLTRQNQQQALAMAGFACSKEYEQRSSAASRNQTLEAAGFIETRGMPQPLLSGNYSQKNYSNRTAVIGRTAEPSDLIGQYDADNWARADGNKSLPRPGVLLPQASKSSSRYPKGYRKPQNGGGAPQSNTEAARTFLESNQQSRQLVRHESLNARTSKSIPIYENVVDGAVATDEMDSAEGNVTLQSRHSKYSSTPDLQRNLSNPVSPAEQGVDHTGKQLTNRTHTDSSSLSKFGSQTSLQNQVSTLKAELSAIKKKPVLTKSASTDSDIYGSMPNLQRTLSTPVSSTQSIAPQGILANAIKNDQENRQIMTNTASSSSSLASSPDSKRSSQASQASTFTTDSVDTSRSSGSSKSTGSLRSKYGVASGFITLPRKKRISDFAAEGRNSQPAISYSQNNHGRNVRDFIQRSQSDPQPPMSHGHPQPMLQQQNSAPAQFAGVFVDDDDDTAPINGKPGTSPPSKRPSHLQYFTSSGESPAKRTDPLEEGSVGSKDSGYRSSRDRSSASSGSVYSVDSPVADTPPTPMPYAGMNLPSTGTSPTSPTTARKNEVEAKCVAVSIDIEELLGKCHQKESEGDLAMALALCTSAVAKLKSTLKMAGMSDNTRHYLDTKYSTTVIRSRSLHKRQQIARKMQRLDSLDGSNDDRPISGPPMSPISPQQPTRPASTQPILQHHHQTSQHVVSPRSYPSNDIHQREHRPVQQMFSTPIHATDPRTGHYRPHSAQLPRKQYDFNTSQQQGYPRQPTSGYPTSGYSTGERCRRSSEGGEGGPWGSGAPTAGRNPPRRSAVEALTTITHTTQPSLEAPMSDPWSSGHHGDDNIASGAQEGNVRKKLSNHREPSGRSSPYKKSMDNSQMRITHSKPAQIRTQAQFIDAPAVDSTESGSSKSRIAIHSHVSADIAEPTATAIKSRSSNARGAIPTNVSASSSKHGEKDLDHLCNSALEEFKRSTAKKNVLTQNKSAKSSKPVRYVIEVHTMKSIPESDGVKKGGDRKT